MRRILFFLLVLAVSVWAETNETGVEKNSSAGTVDTAAPTRSVDAAPNLYAQNRLNKYKLELEKLRSEKSGENVWGKIYSNYMTYTKLKSRLDAISKQIFKLNKENDENGQHEVMLEKLRTERDTIRSKLKLLEEYADNPYEKLTEPPKIDEEPTIGNPFAIISAVSYRQKLRNDQKIYDDRSKDLEKLLDKLRAEKDIITKMISLDMGNKSLHQELLDLEHKIQALKTVHEIIATTQDVYNKKIDETIIRVDGAIKKELTKAVVIFGVILAFFLMFLGTKYIIQRYMSKRENFYNINKALNFFFINFIILILLFAYIENVGYLVTILGFASAGIAIAMKDWFMSILGWFVIVIGGSVHVGDRVKFVRGNTEYVGDIVDISPLRMTMQEDITLTTYMHNRRSGRIIFIPNNFVFTDMLANYSHAGLKTVWDGIDFTVTYDSNITKAANIAKEVVKKYSKGYTDITRKQLNKLRKSYHLKNTNVEPRIYTFIEPYGVKVSAWYMTNAFATLTLRSTISAEILEAISEADDIQIAYPTQSLYLNNHIPVPTQPEEPSTPETISKKDNA